MDLGHSLLTPLYDWKNASPLAAQVGVTLNSLLILLAACFGAVEAFVHGRPRAIVVCIPAGMMRMTIGVFTRMPEPEGYIPTPGDWPPPSDDCPGFILNPSCESSGTLFPCRTRMMTADGAAQQWARAVGHDVLFLPLPARENPRGLGGERRQPGSVGLADRLSVRDRRL